ncbi:MAG: alpha-galactosidase [Fimbriimonadaceae bacterium]|nr:alpha-galactosidase [Fimbriimonadaceae bacterium]
MQPHEAGSGAVQAGELTAWQERIAPWLNGTAQPWSLRSGEQDLGATLGPATVEPGTWQDGLRQTVVAWTAADGLQVRVEYREFADFPALEWVLHLTAGPVATPLLSDIRALDLSWQAPPGTTPTLLAGRGSDERQDDFQEVSFPLRTLRSTARRLSFSAGDGDGQGPCPEGDGRSSVDWLPFFHLTGDAQGLLLGLGWSGRWAATVTHDGHGTVALRAGQEHCRLVLQPGERLRPPRVALLGYQGSSTHGQNVWRQFMLRHQTPQRDGQPLTAPLCYGSWGGSPTPTHLETLAAIRQRELPYDLYWVDAGWYGSSTRPCPNVFEGEWGIVGDWRVNPRYHPAGLRPIRDVAHAGGMGFLLWIEPARATAGTAVTVEHPDWFLTRDGQPPRPGESLLLHLGLPAARQWAVETVSQLVREHGVDWYREDFNVGGTLRTFLAHDPPDQVGRTEHDFIVGQYAFWDELRRRHPDLAIDNCASGGRRLDLETSRRSLPLWRSDYNCFPNLNPDALQLHTAGLSRWLPLHATSPGAAPGDTYQFRSALAAGMVVTPGEFGTQAVSLDNTYPWDWLRARLAEYHRLRPFWYGDFYPLLSSSLAPDTWLAWQLHRRDLRAGAVLAFRRAESPLTTALLPLQGVDLALTWQLDDPDGPAAAELTAAGLQLHLPAPRTSRLVFYQAS